TVPGTLDVTRHELFVPGVLDSGRAALRDCFEPASDLCRRLAEVVEPRQLREALEPENTLEQRCRPVPHGAAVVAPRLGDQATLDETGDDRVGGHAAEPGDVGTATGSEIGDHGNRPQRRLRQAGLDGALEEPAARLRRRTRSAERVPPGDAFQHDPAPAFRIAPTEQLE